MSQHVRIQLHRIDRTGAVAQRPQHLRPAAGAQHQRTWVLHQMVGERRSLGFEIAQIGVGAGDRAGCAAVGEEADLLRRAGGRHQAEAGRMAKRHARALHRSEPAERAVTLRHDAGVGRGQRQAQPLVGRGMRPQPVIGERCGQSEPGGDRQQRAAPREPSSFPPQEHHPAGDGTAEAHRPQRVGERQRVEQQHHAQGAEARAHQIHAVERAGPRGVRPKGQRQGQRRTEERQRQHEVESEEPAGLGAVPRDLERVERQRLRQGEGQGRSHPEAQRGDAEGSTGIDREADAGAPPPGCLPRRSPAAPPR